MALNTYNFKDIKCTLSFDPTGISLLKKGGLINPLTIINLESFDSEGGVLSFERLEEISKTITGADGNPIVSIINNPVSTVSFTIPKVSDMNDVFNDYFNLPYVMVGALIVAHLRVEMLSRPDKPIINSQVIIKTIDKSDYGKEDISNVWHFTTVENGISYPTSKGGMANG